MKIKQIWINQHGLKVLENFGRIILKKGKDEMCPLIHLICADRSEPEVAKFTADWCQFNKWKKNCQEKPHIDFFFKEIFSLDPNKNPKLGFLFGSKKKKISPSYKPFKKKNILNLLRILYTEHLYTIYTPFFHNCYIHKSNCIRTSHSYWFWQKNWFCFILF